MSQETVLPGGFVAGAVRVGSTVRKAAPANAAFVARVLGLLREWEGAPECRGVDERGRQVLGFVEGEAGWRADRVPDGEVALAVVGRLVREFHDLTAGSALVAGAEVVCHNDLSPRNTVYREGVPVAFVDWDLAGPGRRIDDVAHACWQFVPLGPAVVPGVAAGRVEVLVGAYQGDRPVVDRGALAGAVLGWQERCWRGIAAGAQAGDPAMVGLRERGVVEQVRAAWAWTSEYREVLG